MKQQFPIFGRLQSANETLKMTEIKELSKIIKILRNIFFHWRTDDLNNRCSFSRMYSQWLPGTDMHWVISLEMFVIRKTWWHQLKLQTLPSKTLGSLVAINCVKVNCGEVQVSMQKKHPPSLITLSSLWIYLPSLSFLSPLIMWKTSPCTFTSFDCQHISHFSSLSHVSPCAFMLCQTKARHLPHCECVHVHF